MSLLLIVVLLASAAKGSDSNGSTMENQLLITVGQKTFTATLEDSATAMAFKAMSFGFHPA